MVTPHRSEDLIADARDRAETLRRMFPNDGEVRDDTRLVDRLADALEVAEACATEAEAARDAALAVIEKAKAHEWSCWGDSDTHRILSSVPADVLRERDRRVQAEAAVQALREAADEVKSTFADPDRRRPKHPKAEVATDYVNDAQWAELIVRERAARIEQNGEGNET